VPRAVADSRSAGRASQAEERPAASRVVGAMVCPRLALVCSDHATAAPAVASAVAVAATAAADAAAAADCVDAAVTACC
jgi:hypothetical protein